MSAAVIAFGAAGFDGQRLDEATFLRSIAWRRSSDAQLSESARNGDLSGFCEALRRRLKQWDRRVGDKSAARQALPRLIQPLWSQHAWDDPPTTERLSQWLMDLEPRVHTGKKSARRPSSRVSREAKACLQAAGPDASPWAQLVWLTVLTQAAPRLDDATLFAVWRQSLVSALSLANGGTTTVGGDATDVTDDRHLLLCGELPWLAGQVFADVKGAGKLARQGRNVLRDHLEALTDRDGTPHARALHRLPLTLAVFVRSQAVGQLCGEPLFGKRTAARFADLTTQSAAMARADGRLALSNGASFATGSLLRTAALVARLPRSAPSSRRLLSLGDDGAGAASPETLQLARQSQLKRARQRNGDALPSSQSDWAELMCMRNNWLAGGDACIMAYHSQRPQLNVTAFERLLIDGEWSLEINVDGTPIAVAAAWSCVCWFSDDDADYIELQQQTEAGVTLLRQVLLSRTDHWLLLADNVQLDAQRHREDAALQVISRVPLARDVQLKDNRWTRELAVRTAEVKARVYPLALAQERVDKADGALTISGQELLLEQSGVGRGLFVPLVIDWSPDRQRGEAQWRPVTVAEDGRALPRAIACGQRLRIGKHQWLFYRSQRPGETGRSVLGHHTPHETVIAEFSSQGEVEPIVLVESSTD